MPAYPGCPGKRPLNECSSSSSSSSYWHNGSIVLYIWTVLQKILPDYLRTYNIYSVAQWNTTLFQVRMIVNNEDSSLLTFQHCICILALTLHWRVKARMQCCKSLFTLLQHNWTKLSSLWTCSELQVASSVQSPQREWSPQYASVQKWTWCCELKPVQLSSVAAQWMGLKGKFNLEKYIA